MNNITGAYIAVRCTTVFIIRELPFPISTIHPPPPISHPSPSTPHSPLLTLHSSPSTPHSPLLTLHSSPSSPHPPPITLTFITVHSSPSTHCPPFPLQTIITYPSCSFPTNLLSVPSCSSSDCPWCEIKRTHASYQFVKTHFDSKKKEKWEAGFGVKARSEPRNIV